MTLDEMRAMATDAWQHIFSENELAAYGNKIVATIWGATAEICERLDRAEERVQRNLSPTRIGAL